MRTRVAAAGMINLSDLELRGVRWVVLHTELEQGHEGTAAIAQMLQRWYGLPVESGAHRVWDVTCAGGRMVPLGPERE